MEKKKTEQESGALKKFFLYAAAVWPLLHEEKEIYLASPALMTPRQTFLPFWLVMVPLMVTSEKISLTSSTTPVTVRVSPMKTGFANLLSTE